MKKKLFLFTSAIGLAFGLHSQSVNNPPDEVQTKINTIYAQLNIAKITTGYLFQKGIQFIPMKHFNGANDSILQVVLQDFS